MRNNTHGAGEVVAVISAESMSVMTYSVFGIAALPGVLDANMGSKLFVQLGFVLPLHFFKRFANERTNRLNRAPNRHLDDVDP